MVRLQHSLNTARGDPEKDYHLAIELDRIFEEVEQSGEVDKETRSEMGEIDENILISEICGHLERRQSEENMYQAVRDIIPLYQDGIHRAINKNWYNVAAEYYYQLIYIKSHLSGHNADTEIENALSFLFDNHERVSSNRTSRIIDLIERNLESISDDRKDEWVNFVELARKEAHSENAFDTERAYLRKLHDLKSRYNEDITEIEDSIVETYRSEAEWQENSSLLVKADVLRAGINECGQYMSDKQREEWKKEALEARKRGTEEEMVELTLEDLPDMEYSGDMQEDVNDEMMRNADLISNMFKHLSDKYDHPFYALYCILSSEALIPDVTRMRLSTEEFVFQEMFSKMVISPEYNTLSKIHWMKRKTYLALIECKLLAL